MSGLPEITLAGTLTADPELRFTPNGIAVSNFTVATNDRRFDKDTNTWKDGSATFLRCTIWRQPAEHVGESLSKGTRVLLTGTLRQREWETDTGEKRYAFEVDVTEIGPSLRWATATVKKATRTGPDSPPPLDEPPF
ncbi:MAG: single-stranded DNA-binding protein [Labedaea sp.]